MLTDTYDRPARMWLGSLSQPQQRLLQCSYACAVSCAVFMHGVENAVYCHGRMVCMRVCAYVCVCVPHRCFISPGSSSTSPPSPGRPSPAHSAS